MRSTLMLLLTAAGLTACAERPAADRPDAEVPPSPAMFAGLPVLPGARVTGGTTDAAEAVVLVAVGADSVARFYRHILAEQDWAIRGDATAPDGSVTLHAASSEGRPIWIMIRPVAPTRAEVSVIASAPPPSDSATPQAPPPH